MCLYVREKEGKGKERGRRGGRGKWSPMNVSRSHRSEIYSTCVHVICTVSDTSDLLHCVSALEPSFGVVLHAIEVRA
jgi:hypothetical protein